MSTSSQEYVTDLTDAQCQVVERRLAARRWRRGGLGRPPCDVRLVLNGIFYRAKTGCPWPVLPSPFGCWKTVYGSFSRWRRQGPWKRIMDARTQSARRPHHRRPLPSAGIVDAQSVKSAPQGKTIGYDAGKKVKGRKRPLLVDTAGPILECVVTAASPSDAEGLKELLNRYFASKGCPLKKRWGAGGYRGQALNAWVAQVKKTHKIDLQVVSKHGPGFEVLPRRWVVERTVAWLNNYRVHAKDYEGLPCNSEAFIQIAMIHLLLNRIGKQK